MTANQPPAARQFDPVQRAMHEMPYGMYVIGSFDEIGPNVMVADWVMQVSFEPRLVGLALERDSRTLARMRDNAAFSVNLLPADQDSLTLLQAFVQPSNAAKVDGRSVAGATVVHDKLAGVDFRAAANGCPILADAMAWFTCEAEQFVEFGDHVFVVGRVLDGHVERSEEPMTSLYTGWTYSG